MLPVGLCLFLLCAVRCLLCVDCCVLFAVYCLVIVDGCALCAGC